MRRPMKPMEANGKVIGLIIEVITSGTEKLYNQCHAGQVG